MQFKAISLTLLSILTITISSCTDIVVPGGPIPPPLPLPKISAGEIVQIDKTDYYKAHKDTFRKLKTIEIRLKSDRDQYFNMLKAYQ